MNNHKHLMFLRADGESAYCMGCDLEIPSEDVQEIITSYVNSHPEQYAQAGAKAEPFFDPELPEEYIEGVIYSKKNNQTIRCTCRKNQAGEITKYHRGCPVHDGEKR